MALNQMIAQGAQFNMPDPVAQYAKMQQLQAIQNQNSLAQYQLGSAQRGDMQQNALYARLQDPNFDQANPQHLASLSQFGTPGIQAMKAITEASNARQTGQKLEGENRGAQQREIDQIARNLSQNPTDENIQASKDIIQKSSFYSPEAKTKALAAFDRALQIPLTERGSYFGMQGATAGDVARANRPIAVGGSLMSPTGQTIASAPEPGFTLSPGQMRFPAGYGGVVSAPAAVTAAAKPPEKLEIMEKLGYPLTPEGDAAYEAARRAPPTVSAPPVAIGEMRALGIPETPEGFAYYNELKTKTPVASATKADRTIANVNPNDFTPKSLDKYLISGKYADLVPVAKTGGGEGGGGAGGAAGTGTVEVVNPKDPTKTIIVTKARAVAEGLTPAKAMEGLTPVQRQKLEASYPVATTALKGHQNKTAQFIKDLEELRDHPGLDSVTGFAAGRAPGLTDAGRVAVAKYDKVVAKGGFQALQDMRDMSKTGGALGNVSDKENQQLKASFAAIDRKQNAKDVRAAIDDLIKELRGGVGRLQDAYDLTYEYKKGRAAPAASGVDANNPLLK